ncbi:hypothetical protein [Actinoallomurus sp. NPDC050550]|uniref:hypothetical protein n=1 Tax=Actinoallomurus sp. NPDC050550 TaxID=3154937 RepID=UPI0033F18298
MTRAESRYRFLAEAEVSGTWRVHLMAAGRGPLDAVRVGALLCAATDLAGRPYLLRPVGSAADLATAIGTALPKDEESGSPFLAGSDIFQALARDDDPGDRPHPDTDAWLARGLDLTGLSAADQLAALRRMPLTWNPDRTAIDGIGDPPEHLRLTAALSDAPTPKERFIESVLPYLQFANGWPLIRLLKEEDEGE